MNLLIWYNHDFDKKFQAHFLCSFYFLPKQEILFAFEASNKFTDLIGVLTLRRLGSRSYVIVKSDALTINGKLKGAYAKVSMYDEIIKGPR